MQTCTGASEIAGSLTLEDLSRVYDLAVKAAQKEVCRFLRCLFPDAEIDPEKKYLLLMDQRLAQRVGTPFGSQASEGIFGRLTIRYSRHVPHGGIYLIEEKFGLDDALSPAKVGPRWKAGLRWRES